MRFTLSICLLLSFSFASVSYGADKPNVLFLICDDLNCDLGAYGHPQVKSPNIDALAARGVRFENCHCQYPLCGPSRASFMTGMYPDQTLIRRNAIYIREHIPNVMTMAQMFRNGGYFATRIGKIFHYNVPLHIGTSGHDDPFSWDYTINPRGRDRDDEELIFTLKKGQYGGTLSWLAADGTDEEQTDGIAAIEAAEQLRKYAKHKTPFFLAVGLYRPHTPYVSPKKYFEMYPVDKIDVPQIPKNYLGTIPKPAVDSISRRKEQWDLDPKIARQAIQAYHASITFADAQVGKILKALDDTGLADNTIVVFTSDHGYHMGEHGHYQKTTLFENATHVPLIIAGPGVKSRGKAATSLVEMVDIYPTLADLANLTPPKSVSGKSLLPALSDPSAQLHDSVFTQLNSGYSIRTPRYRYTEWGNDASQGAEFYDRSTDPEELVNLIDKPDQQKTIQELSKLLRQRIAEGKKPPVGVKQLVFDDERRVPQQVR